MTREEALSKVKGYLADLLPSKEYDEVEEIIKALEQETCDDAISKAELIEALNTWDKFGYAPTNELIPLRGNVDKDKYVPYIHYDDVIKCIKGMPPVTPQPKTGHWITKRTIMHDGEFYCNVCDNDAPFNKTSHFCPNCGAKMTESEEFLREYLGETKHPFPENVGDLCEMNVDGTWIRGKIVDGYRFRDGIVTIKDEFGNEYWCGAARKDLYRQV